MTSSSFRIFLALLLLESQQCFLTEALFLEDLSEWAYIIQNPASDLVLDATDHKVHLVNYTGVAEQLWKLEHLGAGKFLILNMADGFALDIQFKSLPHKQVITWPKHGRANQQWFINYDGSIVNNGENGSSLALDINDHEEVVIENKNGNNTQQFQFYVVELTK